MSRSTRFALLLAGSVAAAAWAFADTVGPWKGGRLLPEVAGERLFDMGLCALDKPFYCVIEL